MGWQPKMIKLLISPEAVRDLEMIGTYISRELHNPASADKTIRAILRELRILERYAEAGPSVEALTGYPTDLRILVCGRYVALYRIDEQAVSVARILNAKQDYLRFMESDGVF